MTAEPITTKRDFTLPPQRRRAMKDRTCDHCGYTIPAGWFYDRQCARIGGQMVARSYHTDCDLDEATADRFAQALANAGPLVNAADQMQGRSDAVDQLVAAQANAATIAFAPSVAVPFDPRKPDRSFPWPLVFIGVGIVLAAIVLASFWGQP